MQEFYNHFYAATETSPAHHAFCERVFGKDLCQHGFANLDQIDLLLKVTGLGPGQHALDLGCGSGLISEYISDCSGAHVTGLDYIPLAIDQARQRTAAKASRLEFLVGDINKLELPAESYDVIISIDTMYFSDDYPTTLRALQAALRPAGQMAILFSHGREPWVPVEQFDKESVQPDRTPLAAALKDCGLPFRTWDLTRQDYELALRRKAVLEDLKPMFEAEGNLFLYENRMGDAKGISHAIEEGLQGRYLYLVRGGEPS